MVSKLSRNIKKARKNKGLTLDQLARAVGSSKSYMWQLENSSEINPSVHLIGKIADELNVTVDYLIDAKNEGSAEKEEFEVFFRDFKGLDEQTQKGLLAQVEALKKLKRKE